MPDITTILSPACTKASIEAHSRKRALEAAADLVAEQHPDLSARKLFDELMARERLGSTGLGDGVAIPHCRIPCEQITGALLRLQEPVDYESMDDEPVDLLFVLAVPSEETTAHLDLLAALARIFGDPENRRRLRSSGTDEALYQELVGLFSSQAA
ncbi:MAG: PTS IIA-like nitrogen regulatory protein PtsN [Pseudomonadales bacterium]|nr:PTS IIA-like nitrogen regulatory protein PtsN [Pseudomonadales bacterium]NIX06889.1 PTS IIA-like nitrogen regulatory protein PtsN [Pseudomonadales bacterium]